MPPPPPLAAPVPLYDVNRPTMAPLHWSQDRAGFINRVTTALIDGKLEPEGTQFTTTAINVYMDLTGRARAAHSNPVLNSFRNPISPSTIVWCSQALTSNLRVDQAKVEAYISIGVNQHGESAYNIHRRDNYNLPSREQDWLDMAGMSNATNTAVSRLFDGDREAMKEIGGVDVNVSMIGSVKALDRAFTKIMTQLPKEQVRIIRSTFILLQYQTASHISSLFIPDRPDDSLPVYLPTQSAITLPKWMLRSRIENALTRARMIRMLHNCNLPIPNELHQTTSANRDNRQSAPRGTGRNSYQPSVERYNPKYPSYNRYGNKR